MEHDDDFQKDMDDQSTDLSNSTTSALVRRLFNYRHHDYMARAVR